MVDLMREYVVGRIGLEEFSRKYLSMWRLLQDSGQTAREQRHVQRGLDAVFTAIDSFDTDLVNGQEPKQREAILSAEVRVVLSVLDS